MKIEKNYVIVHNLELVLFDSMKDKFLDTPQSNTIFESDVLQESIDYLLENGFLNFTIPIILFFPNCDKKYWKEVHEVIVNRYENGQPVTESTLIGYVEMSKNEKYLTDLAIYENLKKGLFRNLRYMLVVDYSYIMTNYTPLAIMMLAKETVLNDVRLENSTRVAKLWFSEFETESDRLIVETDPILKAGLRDVESYKPILE